MNDKPLNCVGIDPTKQNVGSYDFRPTVPLSTTAGLPELTATPMQPLIERVARAICAAAGWNPDEPEESSSPGWKEHVPEAQAAIAECRVEEMREALRKMRTEYGKHLTVCGQALIEVDNLLASLDGKPSGGAV